MEIIMDEKTLTEMQNIRLPRYREIPNVGLYLKQTVQYINDIIEPFMLTTLTETMVSNYVKMHLVPSPTKKLYNREQIAHLLFITMSKTVLSMDNIQIMLSMQRATHDTGMAYDYYCREFENVLRATFGLAPLNNDISQEGGDEKKLLRKMILIMAQKVYLSRCFQVLGKNRVES